ncbi:MAG: hypothetical protein QOF78_1391 [Phycisphaerales bacterium]|jgi:hypothetical protein|nr:hypothetical protein [Phycisphaerales bacterium]
MAKRRNPSPSSSRARARRGADGNAAAKRTRSAAAAASPSAARAVRARRGGISYCSLPQVEPRRFGPDVNPGRMRLIIMNGKKWVNGTVLHYYFFDRNTDGAEVVFENGTREWRPWTTNEAEKQVVRDAFQVWVDVGIGLRFQEVAAREDAEIRIGFMRGDGAWSYIGRDILNQGRDQRTMNFGWDLTRPGEIDTAVHEIGHTLGFPHEHQNPNAGIVWDEEAVYTSLAQPPNEWDREKTFYNIIRKIRPDTVQGSSWDANSIMHYPFEAGLIKEPAEFRNGLQPAGGLSERDKTWVKTFYPPLTASDHTALTPAQSVPLKIAAGQQSNFTFAPAATRYYELRTFGTSDTVVVLFEKPNGAGEPVYISGDDDSGEDRNAYLRVKLFKGRNYIVRVRLYYADRPGETAVMLW